MSRSDNTFPKYVKLKVNPNNPPNDLWDRGARRCISCGLAWPNYTLFNPSPCCRANTVVQEIAPEIPWSEAVDKLLHFRFEHYYDQWNDDATDEQILFDETIEVPTFASEEEEFQRGLAEIEQLVKGPVPSME